MIDDKMIFSAVSAPALTGGALPAELVKHPHALIAGTTGSGKSVLLRSVVAELLRSSNAEFVAVDLKRVELIQLRESSRLCAYADEPCQVCDILDAVLRLMEARYAVMQERREQLFRGTPCYILIDELADVLAECGRKVEEQLARLARLARAADIHIIACTQSPSRSVLRARIIQNIPARVALRCGDAIESRQIVGVKGAEELPLYGSALVRLPGRPMTRVDGLPVTSSAELAALIAETNRMTYTADGAQVVTI